MRNTWLVAIVAGALGASGGAVLTWWLMGTEGTAVAAVPAPQRAGPDVAMREAGTVPADAPVLDESGLDLAMADESTVDGGVAAGDGESADTPEQAMAAERAHTVVDQAIRRQQWTEADAHALRGEFDRLSGREQGAVMRKFATAVNRGEIEPLVQRIPF